MPGQIRRLFVTLGELRPDGRSFSNDSLTEAFNVVPMYGNYIACQFYAHTGSEPPDEPYGLHTHFSGGSSWQIYLGSVTTLLEYNTTSFASTDKTRSAGGAYAAGGSGGENGWQFVSFGQSVVATNYVDDPQLLPTPASTNFEALAQSGGANPGMAPRAKFCFGLRGNLFLANLNLSAPFDTLPAGANPTTVAWSMSDNIRQFGSFNVTPELTGTGHQTLGYDIGHITGGVGGLEYGILACQAGFVRIDGPPYVFRPIIHGVGCRFPNSIVRLDGDIYLWSASGPAVLRGGEGPLIILGEGRIARTLIDNSVTGFSPTYSISSSVLPRHVNASIDATNGLVIWTFTSTSGTANARLGDMAVIYNARDNRFSFMDNRSVAFSEVIDKNGLLFLKAGPDVGGDWSPGRDLVGLMRWVDELGGVHYQIARPDYGDIPALLPMLLTRAYQQLDTERTTRIRRVRPVLSRSESSSLTSITVTISSKNRPYSSPSTTSSTTLDPHNWITTPDAKYADFHSVSLSIDGTALETIVELEGFEVEYEIGGAYSA